MKQSLHLQPQLRQEQRGMPQLTARLLTLNNQQLQIELEALALQNPAIELCESKLPRRLREEPTLTDHLLEQLAQTPLAATLRADAMRCVHALNQRGYLPRPAALASVTVLPQRRARAAAQILRSLHPTGVGAHDLADCLALQLTDCNANAQVVRAARRIVRSHFDALARRRHDLLPRRHRDAALALITTLRPRFANDFTPAAAAIVPDLQALRNAGVWRVRLYDDNFGIILNDAYAQHARNDPVLRRLCRQASRLDTAIAFRQRSVLAVGQALVDRQRGFFERGPTALQPVRLREIAADTGLAISTVSATMRSKYLAAPRGVVALKYLFQRATGDSQLGAAASLQEAIKHIIADENPRKPLSDRNIMLTLQTSGSCVPRRTITKHRLAAGILAAHLRRRQV